MIAILVAGGLLIATMVVVRQDLLPWGPDEPPPARPLSTEEVARLATMRQLNWQDARAGVRATIGQGAGQVHLTGWVDWRRPMVYLARSGATPGTIAELVQAVPDLVATRSGDPAAPAATPETDPPAGDPPTGSPPPTRPPTAPPTDQPPPTGTPASGTPAPGTPPPSGTPTTGTPATITAGSPATVTAASPAPAGGAPTAPAAGSATPPTGVEIIDPRPAPPRRPPADGWRVRRPGADGPPGAPTAPGTIDALAVLLLTVAAEDTDPPALLAETESQWLRHDRTAGYEVDVLLGPAILPSPPPPGPPEPGSAPSRSLASHGGAVQYWLDGQARLRRLEALLSADTPVRVELDRDDRTAAATVAVLGGGTIDPRQVTDAEATMLSELRLRNHAAGGGSVRVTVPAGNGGLITGAGWLDWQLTFVYLALERPSGPTLLWADAAGLGTRTGGPGEDGRPPLPVPVDGWNTTPWEDRGDDRGGYDLDLLVNEALRITGVQPAGGEQIRQNAAWLRRDRVAGTQVDVYEIPRPIEADVEPGQARLRYWVDPAAGVLRRLEIRTRSGGFGQLDVDPGQRPEAPHPPPP